MSKLCCTHRKYVHIPQMKYINQYGAFIGSEHLPPNQEGMYWVDCGKCYACKLKRRKQWITRLVLQMAETPRAFWSLFTYNNETVPAFNELGKKRFQAFIKRFRRYLDYHWHWKGIKYFVSGEYGEKNHRPHFHAIIYNLPPCPYGKKCICLALKYRLEMLWKQGFVKTKMLEDVPQIYYTTKYAVKGLYQHKNTKPCILFSKGLGVSYIKRNIEKLRKKVKNPFKIEVPIFVFGKYKFNLACTPTYRKYIFGRIIQLYRCIHYKHVCCNFSPFTGHPFELDDVYKFSKYVEEAVNTGNKKLEEFKL